MNKFKFSNLASFPAIILFILSFSSSTMVSQTSVETNVTTISLLVNNGDDKVTTSKSEISAETNFNFVSWFMGTKQTIQEESLEKSSAKKMLINARIAPNRLLMKAFLKKAQNQISSLA